MFCWRITKYNPCYRNSSGAYKKDEWTSFLDIGKTFDGEKLTRDQYEKVEDTYVQAISAFMHFSGVQELAIKTLERQGLARQRDMAVVQFIQSLSEGQKVTREMVEQLARLILQERMWCKFESEDMYIHFGYDYYMYIGTKKTCESSIAALEKRGLFFEPFESPYGDDDE